jgi:hypothetical protein
MIINHRIEVRQQMINALARSDRECLSILMFSYAAIGVIFNPPISRPVA